MKAGDKVVSVIDDSLNVVLWVEARVLAHVYNEWERTRYVGSVELYREAAEGEYAALLLMGASTCSV